MANVHFDFEVSKGTTPEQKIEGKVKPGSEYFGTHMIFDIKTDGNFTRKDKLVACVHNTAPP